MENFCLNLFNSGITPKMSSMAGNRDNQDDKNKSYESKALTRSEYISALSHLYRGEMYRAQVWRMRLDTTTNWALVAMASIITFALNKPQYSQETLIIGMYVALMFLLLEARRFRFFDVWRARVRMIEENFYGPILRRDPDSSTEQWGEHVADDLLHPKFKITLLQAVKARLVRNYLYIFGFLLIAWIGRLLVLIDPNEGWEVLFVIGAIPAWLPIGLVVILYAGLIAVVLFTPRVLPPEECYWPDPRHRGEDVPSLDV